MHFLNIWVIIVLSSTAHTVILPLSTASSCTNDEDGASKATTPDSKQTARPVNECRRYGPTVTVDKTVLVSSNGRPLYLTDMVDY